MKVLLFNLERNVALRKLLEGLKIEYVYVPYFDYSQSFSYLLDKSKRNELANSNKRFDEEMMVIEADDKELDNLLMMLKSLNINIPLKAVITEHNINWTPLFLRDELIKERKATLSFLLNK